MSNRRWRTLLAMLVSFVFTCAFISMQGIKDADAVLAQTQAQSKSKGAEPTSPSGIVGIGRCAGITCHGADKPRTATGLPIRKNEYTFWKENDKPHQDAFAVLRKPQSKMIAQNLAKLEGRAKPERPAHQDARCLACHSVPGLSQGAYEELGKARRLDEGVGCESCHGPAEKWVRDHTRRDWRIKTAEEKSALGMNDTEGLTGRATVCAGCHVGTPADKPKGAVARDAFHDIMAAGHPRLSFEFSNFLESIPPHWEEDQSKDFSARVWFTGQIVSATAALELLENRARAAAANRAPWPEFAEYDCLACHHDLKEPSWIQETRKYGAGTAWARHPGALPWGTWYLVMLKDLATRDSAAKPFVEQLISLEKLMAEPFPDAQKVAAAASKAVTTLRDWAKRPGRTDYSPAALERLMKDWVKVGTETPVRHEYDPALQLYLALAALNQSAANAKIHTALEAMYDHFEKGPPAFDPRKFADQLRRLHQQLEQ